MVGGRGQTSACRTISSGGIVYVRLGVRNHTRKRVSRIRFALWHRVTTKRDAFVEGELSQQTQSVLDSNCRLVAERTYRGDDWQFDPEEEREVTLALTIPHNSISLRNTTLLRVSHILQVSLHMHLSKDLTVELPIYVTHPASWSDLTPEGNEDTDNDANREYARKVERSANRVYSTYYGAHGIELDANVELPVTSEVTSLASTEDDSEAIMLEPQLSDPTSSSSKTGPTSASLNQGITGWTTNNHDIAEIANGDVDVDDDIFTRLPVKPWTTNAAATTGSGTATGDTSGTPASTFGRGLLPRALHVVNPDQSLNTEAEFNQDTIIARQNQQDEPTAKERPSLSSMNSDIITS
ncbi:hypothetical protein BDF22DRAFT_203701 [Syncephalis plumigaleata]|nr:hypothetical protein BDF22DRAFT_203701 [Syncephalis plumigaleata]